MKPFSPWHLRWDRGYARPRGGRHLARNIKRTVTVSGITVQLVPGFREAIERIGNR